jgi:hypothetical protein
MNVATLWVRIASRFLTLYLATLYIALPYYSSDATQVLEARNNHTRSYISFNSAISRL